MAEDTRWVMGMVGALFIIVGVITVFAFPEMGVTTITALSILLGAFLFGYALAGGWRRKR